MTAGGISNCRSNCTRCGDGIIDPQETCDDGNTNPNDGCGATCQTTTGWDCSVAGQPCTEICDDGHTVGSEECDPPNTIDCPWGATQAASEAACNYCTPLCRNGQGTPHYCGDGNTDAPNEACDDANTNNYDACRNDCSASQCGDGVLDTTDGCTDPNGCTVCDDGNTVDGDGCSSSCEVEAGWDCVLTVGAITSCSEVCGDGLVVGDEVCDDSNDLTETMPYGQLSCNNGNCKAGCREQGCNLSYCGDDSVQSGNGEECDNGTANSNTTPDACRLTCKNAHCGDSVQDSAKRVIEIVVTHLRRVLTAQAA